MVRYPLCLLALALSHPSASAQAVLASGDVLDAFPHSLADARAVAIIPDAVRTRVVAGGWAGHGVLFVRTEEGWADPVFVTLGGGVRPRAGAERADLVLVLRTRRSVSRVLDGDGKIDADVTAYAGRPFAGLNLEGAVLARSGVLHRDGDRRSASAAKARLAELAKPVLKPEPEPKPAAAEVWTLPTPENREAIIGGLAAVFAWLAAFKKRKGR